LIQEVPQQQQQQQQHIVICRDCLLTCRIGRTLLPVLPALLRMPLPCTRQMVKFVREPANPYDSK
jgi:hypothetical protein